MADWRGFGQQLSSAFATSYLDALRRKQDEEQFNRQMKNVEADNLRQDINTYLTLSSKYRPVGQGDMQPVFGAGAPISLPPKEAISFSGLDPNSYLGIRLNDRFFVPREEPVEFDIKTIGKNVYQVPKGAPIDFNNPSYTIPTEEKATDPYLRVIQTERDGKYGDWGLRRDTNEWEFIGGDKPDKPKETEEPKINKYVGDISALTYKYKELSKMEETPDIKTGKIGLQGDIRKSTDEMADVMGLTNDIGVMWEFVNQGYNVEDLITEMSRSKIKAGEKPFTPKQKLAIRTYFNARKF